MDDLVARQQQEIATLRERVRQLEDALVPTDVIVPIEWRLTVHEARLFAFLTTRDLATKQAIMQALYSDRAGDEPEIKIVDVFVCKLRKKLKPFGVDVQTVWGHGYRLADRGNWRAAA
jgi:two-component system cell cycle response regulator CtrA